MKSSVIERETQFTGDPTALLARLDFEKKKLKKIQLLTAPGSRGEKVFWVLSGIVEEYFLIKDFKTVVMLPREKGQWAGWSALFGMSIYNSYSLASGVTEVLEFDASQLRLCMENNPSVRQYFESAALRARNGIDRELQERMRTKVEI